MHVEYTYAHCTGTVTGEHRHTQNTIYQTMRMKQHNTKKNADIHTNSTQIIVGVNAIFTYAFIICIYTHIVNSSRPFTPF